MKTLIIAGAAPDSGNLGVSALAHSAASALASAGNHVDVTLLDYGQGFRPRSYTLSDGRACNLLGLKSSRNVLNSSSFKNLQFWSDIGLPLTGVTRIMRSTHALFDVSAGDSFTDLYGWSRFQARLFPKLYAVKMGIPLVLMPQTYGPFKSAAALRQARDILPRCGLAYARDKHSFDIMKELLGPDFDEHKHRLGVDMAFLLDAQDSELTRSLDDVISIGLEAYGINISGLVFNDPEAAKVNYGVTVDYAKVMKAFVEYVLQHSDGTLWLIPHVLPIGGREGVESDLSASVRLKAKISPQLRSRVEVLSGPYDQCTVKGFISKLHWFAGMRMHSTIAALSSGVPAANVAYSDKAAGVFECVRQRHNVFDARTMSEDTLLASLIDSWRARNTTRTDLAMTVPIVMEQAKRQVQEMLRFVEIGA